MTALTNNTEQSQLTAFDKGYKWLHWSMAFLVMMMLLALFGFADAITTQERMDMLTGHSSIGTLISILLIVRISKRFIKRDPRPVQNIAQWQRRASKVVQMGLYFCMILVPITGYLSARFHELPVKVFGFFDINQGAQLAYNPETFQMIRLLHEWGINLIMLLLVLHIGAALYHKIIKKDLVLASMTRLKTKK